MKNLLMCVLFAGAIGCSHNPPASTTPPTTGTQTAGTDPAVDPTLPSWAPRSCASYHAAVVNFAACNAVDAATREKVSAKYDADNKAWHDMTNAAQSDLDQVKTQCADQTTEVKAQMAGKCEVDNSQPTQALR